MIYRITWADRLRAFAGRVRALGARAWRTPFLVEAVLLAALMAVLLLMSGCGVVSSAGNASADNLQRELAQTKADLDKAKQGASTLTGAVTREHQRVVEADAALAEARGLYTTAQTEAKTAHDAEQVAKYEAQIAPFRTVLLTVSIVAGLVAIAGGVIFALSFVSTALGFGRLIGVIGLIGGGAGVILAQLINAALSHLVLVLAGAVGVGSVALVGWLIWERHRGQQSTREGATTADDAITRLEQMGQTSVEAAKHAAAVKAAAIARQSAIGIKGRIEKTLAHIRPQGG